MNTLRTAIAWVSLACCIAVFLVYRAPEEQSAPDTVQRLRTYDLAEPLQLDVEPGEDEVRLVTWLVGPRPWVRDPRLTISYAISMRFLDPSGAVTAYQVIWTTGRLSNRLLPSGALGATSWLSARGAWAEPVVWVDRSIDLRLSDLSAGGGMLEVQAASLPSTHRLLAVAYRRGERAATSALRMAHGDDLEARDRRLSQLSPFDWDSLPASWQQNVVAKRWERLGALPRTGEVVVPTVELDTIFDHTRFEDEIAHGLVLPPGGIATYNLVGAVTFQTRWLDPTGMPSAPVDTQLRLVHADGTSETQALGAVSGVGPLDLDEPLVSIQIALDPSAPSPRLLRAWTSGEQVQRSWGDPPRLLQPGGEEWLAPDLRSLDLIRVAPDQPPARYHLDDGEMARISVRERLPAGELPGLGLPSPEPHGTRVVITATDAGGMSIEQWTMELAPTPSPFERYTKEDDPSTARASEPVDRVLRPPPGTAGLEVSATGTVDVALRVFDPTSGGSLPDRGYDPPSAETGRPSAAPPALDLWLADADNSPGGSLSARYVPMSRDAWHARTPLDMEALAMARRLVRVDAQVRLVPAEDDRVRTPLEKDLDDWAAALGEHALALSEAVQLIAEPDRDGVPGGSPLALVDARPTRLIVPPSGRLDIGYRVPGSLVGSVILVRAGAQSHARTLSGSTGLVRLVGLEPGSTTVSVGGLEPAAAARQGPIFLAEAAGTRLWQARQVTDLDPGEALDIPAPSGPARLTVYPYVRQSGGMLHWELVGWGSPRSGLFTSRTRREGRIPLLAEGAEARPLTFESSPLTQARVFRVRIGSDMAAESGSIRLWTEGTDRPLMLRATSTWAPEPVPSELHWAVGGER